MSIKIEEAEKLLDTLKQNMDDNKRAHITEYKMHQAVDAYNASGRITAVRSKNDNKPFFFKAQPPPLRVR
jgi:hypothetical protein